jgi:hypothetical protein
MSALTNESTSPAAYTAFCHCRATHEPTIEMMTIAAIKPATAGRRLHHIHVRSPRLTGRATIGFPSSHRPRSAASAAAVGYRLAISFRKHFRQIVSKSRGSLEFKSRGATGSRPRTCNSVSIGLAA